MTKQIPVTISPFFIIMAFAIAFLNGGGNYVEVTLWAGTIFFSVLIHEYGHALTALLFGQKVRIELVGWGGVTIREGTKMPLWKEFLVVFNGPLAGLFLGTLSYYALGYFPDRKSAFSLFLIISVYVNIFWTLVNLLPVYPLDGGQLLRILFEGALGFRGQKVALFISLIVAALLSALCFVFQALLGGILFFMLAFESYRAWSAIRFMDEHDQSVELQDKLKQAEDALAAGRSDQALVQLQELRSLAKKGIIYDAATQKLALALSFMNKNREAYELLYPLRNKLDPISLRLLHRIAFTLGEWKADVEVGPTTYQNFPDYESAVINAVAHAFFGEVKAAVGWLQRAQSDGAPHLRSVLRRAEFDAVRGDPLFREFAAQIKDQDTHD